MNNKLVLITPFGISGNIDEILNKIHNWGEIGNTIREKRVIVNSELIAKHFSQIPSEQLAKIVEEWTGAEILAFIVDKAPDDAETEMYGNIYISSPDRAERDISLWFPEYVIN